MGRGFSGGVAFARGGALWGRGFSEWAWLFIRRRGFSESMAFVRGGASLGRGFHPGLLIGMGWSSMGAWLLWAWLRDGAWLSREAGLQDRAGQC